MQLYISEIITSIFGLIVLLEIIYYFALFARFAFGKIPKSKNYHQDPVSIVIATKNDAHNLIKSLPALLSQQYNAYEVVVVSDKSEDETEMLVKEFQQKHDNLKFVNLTSSITNIKGKKYPLALGIRLAKNNLILLTEPDCIPLSQYWLQNMAKKFVDKTQIVLGYSNYEKKPGLSNALIRFDTMHQAIQYFSYALAKIPYMGVMRNLAYTKELFLREKGFARQNHILYGEDDLFVNNVATGSNCAVEYFSESFTQARPRYSFSSWLRQKRMHNFTRKYYQKKHKFLLTTYGALMPLFYIFFCVAIAMSYKNHLLLAIILGLFAIKTLTQYLVFGFSAKKLKCNSFIPFIIFYDIIFSILNPLIYLATQIVEKPVKKWN